MLRVARFACCVVLLILVSAAGCDEDPPRTRDRSTTSATPTSSEPATSTAGETATPTPTATSSDRLSGIATRTTVAITVDGQPVDKAGLRAIGWTSVDPLLGTAHWSDPSLGELSVTWEVPDERAVSSFDVSFWGEVTGANLAMSPSMSTSVFTGGPLEATAHSIGGTKAETPTQRLTVGVPEQPVGMVATVSINLGFPVPVLVTYSYTYL
jgi:hypothetical protein